MSSFVLGSMAGAGMWYSLFHFVFWTGSFYVAQAEFNLVVLMPPSPSPCIVDMHYHVCLIWDAITKRYPVSNTLVTRYMPGALLIASWLYEVISKEYEEKKV